MLPHVLLPAAVWRSVNKILLSRLGELGSSNNAIKHCQVFDHPFYKGLKTQATASNVNMLMIALSLELLKSALSLPKRKCFEETITLETMMHQVYFADEAVRRKIVEAYLVD